MNIEDLSKSQLLLLTILVNFVVSIATGVLTISMLDQTPTTVTQTVNKIVDHTIETISTPLPVVPSKSAPTTEQLLTAAISADAARTVTIYQGATTTPAIAVGTYLPKSRAVATAFMADLPKEAIIEFPNGTTEPASLAHSGATVAIYGFSDTAKLPAAPASNLATAASLKQGQTVIAITKEFAAVTGIISKVDEAGIHTSLSGIPAGAAAVDLSGNIIGIGSGSDGLFFTSDKIATLLAAPPAGP